MIFELLGHRVRRVGMITTSTVFFLRLACHTARCKGYGTLAWGVAAEGRTIHDTGKGLPDDRLEKVVEAFVRFAVTRDRNNVGMRIVPPVAGIQFQEKIDDLPFARCCKTKIGSKTAKSP